MSKGGPASKPPTSLNEVQSPTVQSLDALSIEQMNKNEAKIWLDSPAMNWTDVAIKAGNPHKCRVISNFNRKLGRSASASDTEES